jgi:hypothetical protein
MTFPSLLSLFLRAVYLALIARLFLAVPLQAENWKMAECPIPTIWAAKVDPSAPWPEYPRPQFVREKWTNLNGLWDYAITPQGTASPAKFDGSILVPFPIESALSGVRREPTVNEMVWYSRHFASPALAAGQRLLLHFEASDWETTVFLNGKQVGSHRGGYDHFSFDITDDLKPGQPNLLQVFVYNPINQGPQAHGKQKRAAFDHAGGIFYTPSTGLWQTVWLEPVPADRLEDIHVVPSFSGNGVDGQIALSGEAILANASAQFKAEILDGDTVVASGTVVLPSGSGTVTIPQSIISLKAPKPWGLGHPFLYDLRLTLSRDGKTLDTVKSYFGMRTIGLGKDEKGITRVLLNGKPVFMTAPLDQGFWPDGIYTAPTDEAMKFDLDATLKYGFNSTRKHIKVEPARWYYWADKLGLLVWQDMARGSVGQKKAGADDNVPVSDEAAQQFESELHSMILQHQNSPSIVMWCIFNEGGGQYDTVRITNEVKSWDPSRLVDSATGWVDHKNGDFHDIHIYPGPAIPPLEPQRAAGLGEFGGLGFHVEGHTWTPNAKGGYRVLPTQEDLFEKYVDLWRQTWTLQQQGLCAAVYTQLTDVENEANGLMTYDRKVEKINPAETFPFIAKGQFPPEQTQHVLVPTAPDAKGDNAWSYTSDKPADDWFQPTFDAKDWKSGLGGFGTSGASNAVVGTSLSGDRIYLRRTVTLPEITDLQRVLLSLYNVCDATVYINGILAARQGDSGAAYEKVYLSPEALATLKHGQNLVAISCTQSAGDKKKHRFPLIDAGLIQLDPLSMQKRD